MHTAHRSGAATFCLGLTVLVLTNVNLNLLKALLNFLTVITGSENQAGLSALDKQRQTDPPIWDVWEKKKRKTSKDSNEAKHMTHRNAAFTTPLFMSLDICSIGK